MSNLNVYQFVGGKRDGETLDVPGNVQVGTIIRLVLVADRSKAELYQMGTDGKFHFVTHAWMGSESPQAPGEEAGADAATQRLHELLQRLSSVLKDLDEVFIARGEFPRGIRAGGWLIQRKEAVTASSQKTARSRRPRDAKPRPKKNPPHR